MKTIVKFIILGIFALICGCSNYGERALTVPSVCTVKFNAQNGMVLKDISELENKTIILPEVRFDGYVFDGWYSDKTGGELLGFGGDSVIIEEDLTLYARWQSILHKDEGDSVINGIVCVFVEAGKFMMGSPEDEIGRHRDEEQHEETIAKNFWLSKYPVTNLQYYGDYEEEYKNYPVTNITWQEASVFAEKKGGFLPTEAQWEFAARGGNKSKNFVFSGSNNIDEVAWYSANSGGAPHAVGQKLPNELGIYDMSGNVCEWVFDLYEETSNTRVCRGGSYLSDARECRNADRPHAPESGKYDDFGFRIAFDY